MPLIEIRALPQPASVDVEQVLARVTQAVAAVLGNDPRGTWATWEQIPFDRYSEGGVTVTEQPTGTHPPLVRVAGARPPELVRPILDAVTETLTRELGLDPDNAFVRWEQLTPDALG